MSSFIQMEFGLFSFLVFTKQNKITAPGAGAGAGQGGAGFPAAAA